MAERQIGAVMVVGGGIAGMQAALDLADSGYFVHLVEHGGVIGGAMARLDKTYPTNDCAMCIMAPKLVECGRHLNIELLTLTDLEEVSGEPGDFLVRLRQRPRYVDMEKCIACGECALKCPKKVRDFNYNEGVAFRKAIFVRYPQAVPLKYRIDPENCTYLLDGGCGVCRKVCPTGAIRFDDAPKTLELRVGAIILASGSQVFDPSGVRTWGFGVFPNVVTSLQMERFLAASGPTEGRLLRPSDKRPVRKVAFLQCVGSRDYNKARHAYCSSVCCMYAIKQTLIAKEQLPELDASIFFVDMRTHGKDFERYYDHARDKGVKFRRCRVHSLEPGERQGDVALRYITDQGKQVAEEFDLVVLSTGMETPQGVVDLCQRVGAGLNHNNFMETSCFAPVSTTRPGIYACGSVVGPKNIPHSVMQASAAAAAVAGQLASARHSLTKSKQYPPELDVSGQEPRVGVFVCHCGSNIAGVIDVAALAEYAKGLPHVALVEHDLFTCSQGSQELIAQHIREHGLNRVVVAACTPRTHESLFKETLRATGLSESLFEMANIRNQASWVHAGEPQAATEKAKDLVRMAVAKVGLVRPLPSLSVGVCQAALVVGGGVAGMSAALGLSRQGFAVHLVEKASRLGGNALHLFKTWKNEPIQEQMHRLLAQVESDDRIRVYVGSQVAQAEGFVGNFRSVISGPLGETVVEHGVTILATGGKAHKPDEYAYGQSRRVFTALEFDKLHLLQDDRIKSGRNFVFIQCVGSRQPDRPYCSRVCCTHAVQAAIALKEENPQRGVFILYRDLRAYGQREELYHRARELGVVFINYEMHGKPKVKVLNDDERLEVMVWDHVLHQLFSLQADVLVLATAIVPHPESQELGRLYKAPVDVDGFFQEAHAKLRPVDFATEGLFMAGLAHYPKPMEETISQAGAAVARASTVLAKGRIELDSIKAVVNERLCDGCVLCLDVCPYHALSQFTVGEGEALRRLVAVNSALCKGCGCCQATCPKNAINVAGFSYDQLAAQIAAALS